MDANFIIGLGAILLAAGCGGAGIYYFFFSGTDQINVRSLMGSAELEGQAPPSETRVRLADDPTGEEYVRFKEQSRRQLKKKKKNELTTEELMFRAGIFSNKQKADFNKMRKVMPFVTTPFGLVAYFVDPRLILPWLVLGFLMGIQAPMTMLNKKVKRREDDILYYLPLVIEQIAIGVSSSLDIGPCLQRVVSMADERDTHNVVTELLRHVQFYVRSGASLEEALTEVGKLQGHNELKHAFMSLAQVAKHGGEISKQLQELADAVASQREAVIETEIKKLELKATGPLALTFFGYLITIVVGVGIQAGRAFQF